MFINPTKETLELTRNSLANGQNSLRKGVTISTGLTWYDLQAPAKNIYPVITPLRNSIPRVQRINASDAARWKQVPRSPVLAMMRWAGYLKVSVLVQCRMPHLKSRQPT